LLRRCKESGSLTAASSIVALDVQTQDGTDTTATSVIDASISPSTTASEAEEQRRIDLILQKLFFSPKNHILSEGITYDATLRYVCCPN
jgi:hypothetical protein